MAFRLLIVGIGEYDHRAPLPVADVLPQIATLFADHGAAEVAYAEPRNAVAHDDAVSQLRSWFSAAEPDAGPVNTVLYWAGHGETDDTGSLLLLTKDSGEAAARDGHAVEIGHLARQLRNHADGVDGAQGDGWTLTILDCCSGGTGVRNLLHQFTAPGAVEPQGLGFVGAGEDGAAFSGSLLEVMNAVLGALSSADVGFTVREFLDRVQGDGGAVRVDPYTLPGDAVFANPKEQPYPLTSLQSALPVYEDLLGRLAPEVRTHFLAKAHGTELDDRVWLFEGRRAPTLALNDWLRSAPGGLYVVTGKAGTGKSAFLGRVVALAEPGLLDAMVDAGVMASRPPDDEITPCAIDAVVHLTAKTFDDVVARLNELRPDRTATDLESLLTDLESLDRPVTIVADALDEALDPLSIAGSLLRRLAAVPNVRVVVGTRRSLREGPDEPDPTDHFVLDALGIGPDDAHDLPDERNAVAQYTRARLTGRGAPFAPDDPRVAVAVHLTGQGHQPFLFARLATAELLARPDITVEEVEVLLSGPHRDLFAAALDRFAATDPKAVPLLRALAYGLGRGFPQRGRIWAAVTEAFHPGLRIREADMAETLRRAGDYIVHDGEAGQATYRLAHRTFAEHFHAEEPR